MKKNRTVVGSMLLIPYRKMLIYMKLLSVFLLGICMSLHASSHSQNAKVSLEMKEVSLNKVLQEVSRQTRCDILYNLNFIKRIVVKDVNVKDKDFLTFLSELLPHYGLGYSFDNNVVVIRTREQQPEKKEFRIKGIVTDEKNIPLPGVTIRLRGSLLGTATNNQGRFSMLLPFSKGYLDISFVGYKTQNVEFTEKTDTIKVVMVEGVEELSDVVVTGYQTLSKERVTGSFSTVNHKDLNRYVAYDITSLLEGKVAGIQKYGHIRGRSTFNATSTPLYVIDGFPVEGEGPTVVYNNVMYNPPIVNPEDIESITVLKDAAAASIYGARATNGVIVITTRKAKQGKAQISVAADVSIKPVPNYDKMDYMSASDYIDYQYEFMKDYPYKNTMRGSNVLNPTLDLMLQVHEGKLSQDEADRKIDAYRSSGTPIMDDYVKYIYRPTITQRYYLSIAKATGRNNIVASLTYTDNQRDFKNYEGNSIDLNLRNSFDIAPWLDTDMTVNVRVGEEKNPSFGTRLLATYTPYTRLVDEEGNPIPLPFLSSRWDQLTLEQYPNDLKGLDAILQDELDQNIRKTKSYRTRAALMLNFKITEWLKFSSGFQYEFARAKETLLYNKESYDMRMQYNAFSYVDAASGKVMHYLPDADSYGEGNTDTDNFTWRNQLNFDYTTKDGMHSITALAGSETRESKGKYIYTRVWGYDDEVQGYTAVNNKELTQFWNGLMWSSISEWDFFRKSETRNRFVSFFGNVMYTFNNRYDITGSIRWDLSDLFGKKKKYLYKPLWSVGAAWTISNEKFMHGITWLDRLRVRATYGINGNVARGVSPYLVAEYQLNKITGQQYGEVTTPPNASLRWEKTKVTNLGVDFAVFKNRLTGSLQYYSRNSGDLLAVVDSDPTCGFERMQLNVGAMTNKGFEVELRGTPVRWRDLEWTAGFTFAYNKNEVTKLNKKPFSASTLVSGGVLQEGRPYDTMYSYRFSRIDENGETVIFDENGEEVSLVNVTSIDAVRYSGTTLAPYTGAIFTTLSYKGLELSLNFIYNAGHKMRKRIADPHMSWFGGPANLSYNGYDKSWKQPGDELKSGVTPRITYSYDADTFYRNDHWRYNDSQVVSASYIKLRNLSLIYNLPSVWLKNTFLKSVSVSAQADNLFFFAANGEKSDPENYNLNNGSRTAPTVPTYSFGINVSF
ncbi:SusC/RagA family TonB-linked outer membrane protein [Odoribacter sp. AF15-53]|nr:SusC/RagA family TonB-linked outer membrane protein [Odoribacter sp. AF15-53]